MDQLHDRAASVRGAPALTFATGTCRYTFLVEGDMLWLASGALSGEIDFVRRATSLDSPDGPLITLNGQRFLPQEAGQWVGPLGNNNGPPSGGDVLWQIELLLGTTSATRLGEDVVRVAQTSTFAATADLGIADRLAPNGLETPGGWPLTQLRAIGVEAWLDSSGCLRRMTSSLPGLTTTVELFDFGAAVDISAPAAHHLIGLDAFT